MPVLRDHKLKRTLSRLRSDLLNPKLGSQKRALFLLKAITSLRYNIFQQSEVYWRLQK